jgi:hypothetical protein
MRARRPVIGRGAQIDQERAAQLFILFRVRQVNPRRLATKRLARRSRFSPTAAFGLAVLMRLLPKD